MGVRAVATRTLESERERQRILRATPRRKAWKRAYDQRPDRQARRRETAAAYRERYREKKRDSARRYARAKRLGRDPESIAYTEEVLVRDPCSHCRGGRG